MLRLAVVPYREAWDLQRSLAEARVADEVDDTLILVEHPSVYTAGRRTQPFERPLDGTEVIDVDRGGRITWHGPGQIVGYPILKLPRPLDVVAYVRALEQALIDTCAEFGLRTRRVEGRSGVWTADGQRKIAAIGVRVRRAVTTHGYALNCLTKPDGFGQIVPCGIADAGVTSLSAELGRPVTVADARPVLERHTVAVLGRYLGGRHLGDRVTAQVESADSPVRGGQPGRSTGPRREPTGRPEELVG
ncbi:lipoyl(octanoyl) transferase LipB [Frankia sp. AiPa1]|nr:lipoyl(octanoyl) transferase LipB [Frankia sp. AiPa1]